MSDSKLRSDIANMIVSGCSRTQMRDYMGMDTNGFRFPDGAQYCLADDIIAHVLNNIPKEPTSCNEAHWHDDGCSCHINPPCNYCVNKEDEG